MNNPAVTEPRIDEFYQQLNQAFEKAAQAGAKAHAQQSQFIEQLIRSNTTLLTELSDAQLNTLKELATSKSLAQAIAINQDFAKLLEEKLTAQYTTNTQAWQTFLSQLADIYTPAK